MTTKQTGSESLTLKWGTLKGWYLESGRCRTLLAQYLSLGSSMSAALQHDTPEQKRIICELIDAVEGEIWNDWEGGTMTKAAAKKYVMEYE